MKLFFTLAILLISTACWAEDDFINSFEINAGNATTSADLISRYYLGELKLDSADAEKDLNSAAQQLDQLIKISPKNPLLYFIKGLNQGLLSAHYKLSDDTRFYRSLNNKIEAYKKAMLLDNQTQTRLSATAYASMKYGLPDKYKIKAIQKELKEGGSGDNESQYWYLHWNNINSLQKAGRYQEAQQALKNMQEELSDEGLKNSPYTIISKQAKTNLNKAIKQHIKTQQKNTSSAAAKTASKKPLDTKTLIIVIISITSFLVFFGLIVYEFKIKKRK